MGYDKLNMNGTSAGAWVEVDLDAISENFDTIRSITGKETKVCAVIKADAYGHGAVQVASLLQDKGADYLAVAVIDEAIELRRMGITMPILVLGPMMPGQAYLIMQHNLTQTITNIDMVEELSKEALSRRKKAKIHIKVDTGMGRIGFDHEYASSSVDKIREFPYIEIEGMFTHFATSDNEDKSYVYEQWENFNRVIEDLKNLGIKIPITHAATSATIIDLPFMKLDMVRPGLMLYGLYPRQNMREKIELKPALKFKARISHLKDISHSQSISYGRKYVAEVGEKIATLPIGYHDGFRRMLTGNSEVLVKGIRCPVVGTVCMDHIMVNVSKPQEANCFEEVVIIGKQGNDEITVDEIAGRLQTISYEVVSLLGRRLPRVFYKDGEVTAVRSLFTQHSLELAKPEMAAHKSTSPPEMAKKPSRREIKARELLRM